MNFNEKEIILKDGKKCLFRNPKVEDAKEMNEFLKIVASETNFILRCPEECIETDEEEAKYLQAINDSKYDLMIVAIVDGKIAGNCQLNIHKRLKTRHRASIGIGILSKYWNKGIGTAMFKEMIDIAKKSGIIQLELEFIEGNDRGQALYEKMGFSIFGKRERSIKLTDGTYLSEFWMVKQID